MRPRRLQPDHLALAALAVLAVVFWGNCLWGGKVPVAAIYQKQMLPWSAVSQAGGETRQWDSLLWDSMAQFYPWRLLLHNAARQGELPLWNPYQFCGYPFVGNGQSAMFYPLNWLYFLIPPKLGMGLSAALHYFLGSFFVFGLARKWRLGTLPAAFSALAFTYGGFMVTWIELPTLVNSLIWLPLAWWGIEVIMRGEGLPDGPHAEPTEVCHPERSEGPRLVAEDASRGKVLRCAQDDKEGHARGLICRCRPAVRGVIMLATALGMTLLAGHFQIAAYVWIFTAIYGLIRLVSVARRDARTTRSIVGAAVAAVILAGMLATVQLLPTLELGRYSARGAGGPSAAGFEFHRQRALQPLELLTLLQADFLGTPVDGTYKGISYSEHCPFVGATTMLLGLIGLALGWRRRHGRLRLWLFFGIAIFALWGAMAGPPAMLLYWGVPKLGQAGGFPRLLSVWTLAAALWGGAGLQVLLDRLTAGPGSTVGRGLVSRRGLRPSVLRTQGKETAPATPAVNCRAEGHVAERPADANGSDAQTAGTGAVEASEGRSATPLVAPQPGTSVPGEAAASISSLSGVRRTLPDGAVQARAPQKTTAAVTAVGILALALLMVEILPWAYRFNPRAEAKDVYPETELIQQLRQRIGSERYVAINDRRAWGLANVPTDVILPPNAGTVYGLRGVDGYDSLFPLVYRAFAGRMEKADPSPLANGNMLLMQDGLPWKSHGTAYVVAASRTPQPGTLVAEADGLGLWQARSPSEQSSWRGYLSVPEVPVKIPADQLSHVRLDVSLASEIPALPIYLVLYDSYYPGWRCAVDGEPEPVEPFDRAFRTVALAYRSRVVDMVYYPASVACGLFVSLLALMFLTALGTSGLWGRR